MQITFKHLTTSSTFDLIYNIFQKKKLHVKILKYTFSKGKLENLKEKQKIEIKK